MFIFCKYWRLIVQSEESRSYLYSSFFIAPFTRSLTLTVTWEIIKQGVPFVFKEAAVEGYSMKFQPAITCSKLTIETLEQGLKYAIGVVLVSLLFTLNISHTLF